MIVITNSYSKAMANKLHILMKKNRLVSIKVPNANNLYSKRNEISIPYYINTDKGLSRKSYIYIDI